jgi:hypothetical protein
MTSRWRWVLSAVVVLGVASCRAEITGFRAAPTGVIAGANTEAIFVREVKGAEPESMGLYLTDQTEILVKGPGGRVQAGSRADLQPGVRIRFEKSDLAYMSLPPGYQVYRIWVLRP